MSKETPTRELISPRTQVDNGQVEYVEQGQGHYKLVEESRSDYWAMLDPNSDDGFALTPFDKMIDSDDLPRNTRGYENYLKKSSGIDEEV